VTGPGVALGSRLRRHREQRGISLREVANTTKIAYPLLEGLERGDVSQWPQGIYRAGFIRAYAAAVGLPADETALEFARAFDTQPESEPDVTPAESLRLMLAPTSRRTFSSRRATVAALDVGIVVGVALLVSLPAGFAPWAAIACCALAYYAGSSLWQGRTPAAAWLRYQASGTAPREVQRSHEPHPPPAEAAMTLAVGDGRDGAHITRERRSGRERRRRPAHEPPHHGQDEGRVRGTGIPAVH
jgi:transcriptional regulator with XRE-family HTH domain